MDGIDGLVFSFSGSIIGLGIRDNRGIERTSVAVAQVDPLEIKRIDAEREANAIQGDKWSIAQITKGKEMSVNELADWIVERKLFRHADGSSLGKTKVRERIITALPDDTEVEVRINGHEVITLLRPQAVNGKSCLIRSTLSDKSAASSP